MPPGCVSALTCINSLACQRPVRQESERFSSCRQAVALHCRGINSPSRGDGRWPAAKCSLRCSPRAAGGSRHAATNLSRLGQSGRHCAQGAKACRGVQSWEVKHPRHGSDSVAPSSPSRLCKQTRADRWPALEGGAAEPEGIRPCDPITRLEVKATQPGAG